MGLMSILAAAQAAGYRPPIGADGGPVPVPDNGSYGGTMDSGLVTPPSGAGGLQDFLPGSTQNVDGSYGLPSSPDSSSGSSDTTGGGDQDPMAYYHQHVLDAYDSIQKASQARIAALQAMQNIKQPNAQPLRISPVQALLAALGAGIAGSSDRMNGSAVAADALSGFMGTAQHQNDVANQNAQINYQNQLHAGNINSEIAGEGVNMANNQLARAQTAEWRASQLDTRRENSVRGIIERMTTPEQEAKLNPDNAQQHYETLNKLYHSAGMDYLMMTPTEVKAAVDGVTARVQAGKDAKLQADNAATGQRIYNAAMANPSSPRSRQMLAIARTYFPPGSTAQQQIDDQVQNIGASPGEVKALTDSQRASVAQQIKGVDKQLDSLEKDMRGAATRDPAKVDAYLKLVSQRESLAKSLVRPAPVQDGQGGLSVSVGGAPAGGTSVPGAPPGSAPLSGNIAGGLPGAALVPTPGSSKAAAPRVDPIVSKANARIAELDAKEIPNAQAAVKNRLADLTAAMASVPQHILDPAGMKTASAAAVKAKLAYQTAQEKLQQLTDERGRRAALARPGAPAQSGGLATPPAMQGTTRGGFSYKVVGG